MAVQQWLLSNILTHAKPHPSSFAYERGKSVVKCAHRHLGAEWLVKFDIHSFFPSIDEQAVFKVIHKLGYRRLVAFEIARLCTRVPRGAKPRRARVPATVVDRYTEIDSYRSRALGFLPQGAPTSGALANLISRPIDEKLTRLSRKYQLSYTRYADDLTFSSAGRFDRRAAVSLISEVATAVNSEGFTLHNRKTRITPPGARKIVLGLLVDGDRVRLRADFRKRLLENIRGVEKFGLRDHVSHLGYSSPLSFVDHMRGCLAYAYDVDQAWALNVLSHWKSALAGNGLELDFSGVGNSSLME